MAIDYQGIITQGLKNDAGVMDYFRVITRGYLSGVTGPLITVVRGITAFFTRSVTQGSVVAKRSGG